MSIRKILIAASGTGGHLMPALHVARALRQIDPECEILFVGSGRPLEAEIIDSAGFKRAVLETVGLKRRGVAGLFQFLATLPKALLQCLRLFREFKPEAVLGVGGYVTFLPILFARLSGRGAWIHEAEITPGLANSVLSLFAHKVSVGFENARIPFARKKVFSGQPVRGELIALGEGQGPWPAPKRLLVMGGSQGAQTLDQALLDLTPFLKQHAFEVWHQCRPENLEELTKHYLNRGITARVMSFIHDTAAAFSWSDLVISRAGAGAVMEIGVVNRPAILVPYPFAQGNHQRANALTLVEAGKALLVEEGKGFETRLQSALGELVDEKRYSAMRSWPFKGRITDAAFRIARGVLELTGK